MSEPATHPTPDRDQLLDVVRSRALIQFDEPRELSSGELSRDFIDAKAGLSRGQDLRLGVQGHRRLRRCGRHRVGRRRRPHPGRGPVRPRHRDRAGRRPRVVRRAQGTQGSRHQPTGRGSHAGTGRPGAARGRHRDHRRIDPAGPPARGRDGRDGRRRRHRGRPQRHRRCATSTGTACRTCPCSPIGTWASCPSGPAPESPPLLEHVLVSPSVATPSPDPHRAARRRGDTP